MSYFAQIDTATKLVDKASEASDRWLFIAALAIIIIGGTLIIRWLVNSLEKKDHDHELKSMALIESHGRERKEWAAVLLESKQQFLEALASQRKDFREELSLERSQSAQERTLDRDARHAIANATNSIGLAITQMKEDISTKQKP